tara:strand:- start:166 stop:579 length:414 start_codon:yes stop_codon:yes gene_type:complete
MLNKIRDRSINYSKLVNGAFEKAVKKTGAIIESENAQKIKEQTISSMKTAAEIAKNIGDLNNDGKVDKEDIKVAAEKAGIAWDKIDPALKSALIAGGVAGIGVNTIPLIGQALAVPTFVGTTAYFFLVAKLNNLKKH